MARNREIFGPNGMSAQMADPGALLDAQRSAAENAARMASTACYYALSMNRAWLEFWGKHLAQYTELPMRFADAQSDFVQRTLGHYQESIQRLGGLAGEAEEEMEKEAGETREQGERTARQFLEETKEIGKGGRSSRVSRASDEPRKEEYPAAH